MPSESSSLLLLSPSIRDWVVFPLLIITFLTGLLRTVTSILLRSSKKIPADDRRVRGVLMRCGRLRNAGGFLSKDRWEARRKYWTNSDPEGPLRPKSPYLPKDGAKAAAANNPMANPAGAMEGMMGNASFMVQNMVMMQTIQHFFSGFVLLKVPFPLTKGFKGMFQRGVDLPTLDVSYVSSVSWYFLVMYGMRGVLRLIIGDPTPDEKQSQQIQSELGNAPGVPPPVKGKDAFKQECDNLEIAKYSGVLARSEKELLGGRYPKATKRAGKKGKNRGDDIFGQMGGDRKKGQAKKLQ